MLVFLEILVAFYLVRLSQLSWIRKSITFIFSVMDSSAEYELPELYVLSLCG